MGVRGTLVVAPDIAQLTAAHLGPVGAGRLEDVDEFRCVVCQLDGNLNHGDDASLVVLEYHDGQVLRLAHARCSTSKVISVEGPAPSESMRDVDVATLPMCMPGPDGQHLAMLFLDRSDASGFFIPGGGFVDPWFQELLTGGWELYQAQLSDLPDEVEGYEFLLDPLQRTGTITAPGGTILLDRLPPDTFDRWFEVAHARGFVVVFAGALRLTRLTETFDFDAVLQLLDDARRRGEVTIARVGVVEGVGDELSAGQYVAAGLERIIHSVHPGDGGELDTLPDLIDLPTPPQLNVASLGDTPTLVLDLNDHDDQRAHRTFKSLQRAGLGIVHQGRPWKAMPDGWGAILWPTQALIQVLVEDVLHKVVFAEYVDRPAGLAWYGMAKQYPAASLLLMVSNLKGRPLNEQVLVNRVQRGRVLGGAMTAMTAI